jgi:hypothetical protein
MILSSPVYTRIDPLGVLRPSELSALVAASLHLLPGFGSSERRPQLGGCRAFPRSEGPIERIRILVAEQKCHFRDIHLRPIEILVRQFLPRRRLRRGAPEFYGTLPFSLDGFRQFLDGTRA